MGIVIYCQIFGYPKELDIRKKVLKVWGILMKCSKYRLKIGRWWKWIVQIGIWQTMFDDAYLCFWWHGGRQKERKKSEIWVWLNSKEFWVSILVLYGCKVQNSHKRNMFNSIYFEITRIQRLNLKWTWLSETNYHQVITIDRKIFCKYFDK